MAFAEHQPLFAAIPLTDMQKKLRIYVSDPTILVMAAVAGAAIAFAIRRGEAIAIALIALGWSVYVVEEYLVHRFVFHAPPPKNPLLFDLLYRLHYGHHDQVSNKNLLFTPLWFSLPLAAIDTVAMSLLLPVRDALIAVGGGGVGAYLVFEWLHLTSHFRASSKGKLGRYITRRHSKHHYIDYDNWFTVSPGGQLVDKAFGSDPEHYGVVSQVRTCGLAADDPRFLRSRLRYGSDTSLANRRTESATSRAENPA